MAVNSVELEGRIAKDPSVFNGGKTKCVRNIIAINMQFKSHDGRNKEMKSFPSLVAFGNKADELEGINKGSLVHIKGYLTTGTYNDKKTGARVYATSVAVTEITVLSVPEAKDTSNGMMDSFDSNDWSPVF